MNQQSSIPPATQPIQATFLAERSQIEDGKTCSKQKQTGQTPQFFVLTSGSEFIDKMISHIQQRQNSHDISIIKVKMPGNNESLDFAQAKACLQEEVPGLQVKLSKILYHCQFISITYLYISGTNIQNCQFLSFLEAPCLKNVYFMINKIVSFKPLLKSRLPVLEILNIEGNFVSILNFQRFKGPRITQSLVLQFSDSCSVTNQDLSSLVKLESQFYHRIRIQSKLRILQYKIRAILHKRFVNSKQKSVTLL